MRWARKPAGMVTIELTRALPYEKQLRRPLRQSRVVAGNSKSQQDSSQIPCHPVSEKVRKSMSFAGKLPQTPPVEIQAI